MRTLDNQKIGERIASIRGSLSRPKFSSQAGIHKNTLERYENGDRSPDVDFLGFLASKGINIHWLITGNGPMMLADMHQVADDSGAYVVEKRDSYLRALQLLEEVLQAKNLDLKPDKKVAAVEIIAGMIEKEEHGMLESNIYQLIKLAS